MFRVHNLRDIDWYIFFTWGRDIICVMENFLNMGRKLSLRCVPFDEAPPKGKIHPFSKMNITFEPQMGFVIGSANSNCLGVAAP